MSIRVAILGYGNLGKGMECAVKQNDDMELVAVFTRRDPATVKTLTDVKVYNVDQLLSMQDKIDVLVLCGGSATDLPKQTAEYAKYFNVVDSFDTHAKIPEHFAQVDAAAKGSHDFRRLGSRYVLPEQTVCQCHFKRRQRLYLLG